jgi:hypothetical protein
MGASTTTSPNAVQGMSMSACINPVLAARMSQSTSVKAIENKMLQLGRMLRTLAMEGKESFVALLEVDLICSRRPRSGLARL